MKYVGVSVTVCLLLLGTLFFSGCGSGSVGSAPGESVVAADMEDSNVSDTAETADQGQVFNATFWRWWRDRYGSGTTSGNTTTTSVDTSSGGTTTASGGTTTTDCAAIMNGYGKNGPYTITYESFENPLWSGGTQVTVFYPKERSGPAPVMFFSHGYGGFNWVSYKGIITNLVTRGFVVVFSPYPSNYSAVLNNYNIMWNGFVLATQKYASLMDLTKVGFLGHSYGGGAVPDMARKGLAMGWGTQGAFMFPMAPWYVYDMSDAQMASFPANMKMIVQVYNEDVINDHRMAIDIFNSMTSVPMTEKTYYNGISGAVEPVGHTVPTNREVNQLDSALVQKPLDALIDYAFNLGSCTSEAKAFALDGQGDLFQHTVTKSPAPVQPESYYSQKWSSSMNPR